MRHPISLLFVLTLSLVTACSQTNNPPDKATPAKPDEAAVKAPAEDGEAAPPAPVATSAEKDASQGKGPLAQLEQLGGAIKRDGQGKPVVIDLSKTQAVDADLALLEGMETLKSLNLAERPITDAGVAHLKGLDASEIAEAGQDEAERCGPEGTRRTHRARGTLPGADRCDRRGFGEPGRNVEAAATPPQRHESRRRRDGPVGQAPIAGGSGPEWYRR